MDHFAETECTITHEGKTYTNAGAYLLPCTDGKWRGVVYVREGSYSAGTLHTVTRWDGQTIAHARLTDYRGNFCKMRRVSFDYAGMHFVGDYCPDWSEACKVRSTKPRAAYPLYLAGLLAAGRA